MQSSDITDLLNEEQLKELKELASENEYKNVVSLQDFRKATEKWRPNNTTKKLHQNTKDTPSKNPY
jgi:SpoVK/Ycf46/Vps4 family AAA+-type ATPase